MIYYARKDKTCYQHMDNSAKLASEFANSFGCKNVAYLAGLLHDLGKYTQAFQEYLKRSLNGEKVTRGEVIHALQGAKYATETIRDPVIVDIISNIVATHHSGLFDNIMSGEKTLSTKIRKRDEELHYREAVEVFAKEISLNINDTALQSEILRICQISQEKRLNTFFMLHLLTKACYSCLVDADRCDAAGMLPADVSQDWTPLIQRLNEHLNLFPMSSALDSVRKNISEQCKQAGERPQGIYTLSIPTGGGKTLSSLRFALEHARIHGLKRIIYVIPYLSILDQTAKTMRCALAACDKSVQCTKTENEREHCDAYLKTDELILEHHSNIELPNDTDDDEEPYRLLTSRWDNPIILTTMVQFLETIYSNKASKLRKFHNMSEAVLIFDEIQALPIKCVHLFNDSVNFLQVFGKSTILLCTATQPHLDKVERRILVSQNSGLVNLTHDELKIFERVCTDDKTKVPMTYGQIADLAKTQLASGKSVLVILNTKADAHEVYANCNTLELQCEKVFLTTDICPAHRLTILNRLRAALDGKRLTLCVSTQLIEAGVDISFGCVIRAEAGLDSIVQAAGRCNRNSECSEPQTVFVVDVRDENLSRLPEIADGKAKTARVFREQKHKNLLGATALDLFYQYYFFEQKSKMDYTTKDGRTTVYNLLNDNILETQAYKDRHGAQYKGLPSAFQTAADYFFVIDGGQTGIVVPYGESPALVAAFQKSFSPAEKIRILKRLQKYTVNVYSHTLSKLVDAGALCTIDDTFYFLNSDWYDVNEQGLLTEPKLQPLIM
jgi:CRISPR-associated endonuclease/helicase Cas3